MTVKVGRVDEATPARVIFEQPVFKAGANANVQCRCGLVRHNLLLACPCGETDNIAGFRVLKAQERLLNSKFAVKSRFWYHSTTRENWEHDVKAAGILAHLGNEQTAHQRALDLYKDGFSQPHYYLYEILINPFASISDNISPDLADAWTGNKEDFKNLIGADVVRYVNTFENSGNVSLYGDPNQFIIIGKTCCIF